MGADFAQPRFTRSQSMGRGCKNSTAARSKGCASLAPPGEEDRLSLPGQIVAQVLGMGHQKRAALNNHGRAMTACFL